MRVFGPISAIATTVFFFSWSAAAEPIKIGLITTLSGPAGYLGQDIRDGFQLAIDLKGGPFEGLQTQLMTADDGLKPGQAKQIADGFLKSNDVKIFTGILFGNIAFAVVPDVLEANAVYVSANTAPASFAGKGCDKNYFVASWQNDGQGESAGALAQALGYKKVFLVAPNYQSGKEAMEAFKRTFKGEVVGEKYTRLDQTDFAVEIAEIRAANPDIVHAFEPGGLGIAFVRQYHQAGLRGKIPMVLHAATLDQAIVKVLGEAAVGLAVTSQWNDDFDNPASKAFVDAWKLKYGPRPVTSYAAQGYDAALLIGSALKATGGSLDNMDAFRAALRKANFASVRGSFKFGQNQHPIQDWYALEAEKGPGGDFLLKTKQKVLSNHGDIYAAECKL
jgi:branched-chain amino acid transport system substrate-binding protein